MFKTCWWMLGIISNQKSAAGEKHLTQSYGHWINCKSKRLRITHDRNIRPHNSTGRIFLKISLQLLELHDTYKLEIVKLMHRICIINWDLKFQSDLYSTYKLPIFEKSHSFVREKNYFVSKNNCIGTTKYFIPIALT